MRVHVTLDCRDIEALACFWQAALSPLGYRRSFDAAPYLSLVSERGGPTLLLQQVPEAKQGMHLDVGVDDLDAEVTRLLGLGARVITRGLSEHGYRWDVLADPEGNEFCVYVAPRS